MSHDVLTRRIIGIETEYGVQATASDGTHLDPSMVCREMFQPVMAEFGAANIFHHNGSRLYIDVGDHPEWATCETTTIADAIAYERSGDVVLADLIARVTSNPDSPLHGAAITLLKNNVDAAGNSYGCHENYLVSRSHSVKGLGALLIPFLLTRQLIAGAGKIVVDPVKEPRYVISQRASHVWESVSSATTRSRPMINTRDEAHADSHQWRRLHVIVGDTNMSQWTLGLKIASMLLVLEMIEAGQGLDHIALATDISALRAIAEDPTGSTVVTLDSGEQMTALEIQFAWLEAAEKWMETRSSLEQPGGATTDELAPFVAAWRHVLEAIAAGEPARVKHLVDWIAKKELIDAYSRAHGLSLDDARLRAIDFNYHNCAPQGTVYRSLVNRGLLPELVDPATIEKAVSVPPATTRAKLRAEFLAHARAGQAPVSVEWQRCAVSRPEPMAVEIGDPFCTSSAEFDALMATLRTHFPAR